MWIMCNDSFVSIVEHGDDPSLLCVRGRAPGDVARFLGLPKRRERETPAADYRYRITARRETVQAALQRAVLEIDYPNYKNSIAEPWRKRVAAAVWSLWYRAQQDLHDRDEVSGSLW